MKSRPSRLFGIIAAAIIIPAIAAAADAREEQGGDAERILRIHKDLIAAHLAHDAPGVVSAEAESILVVSGGELRLVSKKERLETFRSYLANVSFDDYRDIVKPIVRVSRDGTLGWLVARVRIAGERTDAEGRKTPFESVWAWIELYEKRAGRWMRVGEVSNLKPMEE